MQRKMWQSVFAWLVPPGTPTPEVPPGRDIDAQLTEQCRQMALALGMDHLAEQVVVVWNPRMRSTAGRAWLMAFMIELNPRLKTLGHEHVDTTLRHELAHLVAMVRANGRRIAAHGSEWRQACADLGIPGEKACHRLPLPSRKQQVRYLYHCPHCLTEVPRVRKMTKPTACGRCCKKHANGRYDKRFRFVEKARGDQ